MNPVYHFDRVLMLFDYLRIDGWFVTEGDRVTEILLYFGEQCMHRERTNVRLPSHDLNMLPPPHDWRFSISCLAKDVAQRRGGCLRFVLASGTVVTLPLPTTDDMRLSALQKGFLRRLREENCRRVLDLGSRARSGISRRGDIEELGPDMDYWGIDVVAGENVDQVCDAHEMSAVLGRNRFDAICSHVVFEHLAMPWKVAVEMNRVLRPGGIAYISSVQTCGLHDIPWDFFRFSASAYRALFNRATGFEVLDVALGTPMHIVPFVHHAPFWNDSEKAAGFFEAEVVVRKIAETTLDWPVPLSEVVDEAYPA